MAMKATGAVIKYDQLEKIMAIVPYHTIETTKRFIDGDHWRGGDGWIGWRPGSLGSQNSIDNWNVIVRGFVHKNVCKNMLVTLRGAVLGKEPDFSVTPAEGNEEAFKGVDAALVDWWTKRQIHEKMKTWFQNKGAFGKSALRIHIPPGYLNDSGQIEGTTFEEILDKIFVDVPDAKMVVDETDPVFGEKFTVVELAKTTESDSRVFEVCYINEKKETCLRQVSQDDKTKLVPNPANPDVPITAPIPKEIALNLGGNLLTYVKGKYEEALISKSIWSQQEAVNHCLSMANFAAMNINFPEVTFLNADIPDDKEIGPDGKETSVPKAIPQGPGIWRKIRGYVLDAFDRQTMTTPSVHERKGESPQLFDQQAEAFESDMYGEAGMLWVRLSDSEYASGDSKIQSMTSYLILLVDHKTMTDTAGVWLLETVIRLVNHFLNRRNLNDKFRVQFSSKLTIGQLSSEDKRIMMEEVKNNLRPESSYIIEAGVSDDPDTAIKAISLDAEKRLAQETAKFEAEANATAKAAQKFPAPISNGNGGGAKPTSANVN